jgi:hypothetical protein
MNPLPNNPMAGFETRKIPSKTGNEPRKNRAQTGSGAVFARRAGAGERFAMKKHIHFSIYLGGGSDQSH